MFGQDSQLQQGGVLDQADQALADHPEKSQNAMNQFSKSRQSNKGRQLQHKPKNQLIQGAHPHNLIKDNKNKLIWLIADYILKK